MTARQITSVTADHYTDVRPPAGAPDHADTAAAACAADPEAAKTRAKNKRAAEAASFSSAPAMFPALPMGAPPPVAPADLPRRPAEWLGMLARGGRAFMKKV